MIMNCQSIRNLTNQGNVLLTVETKQLGMTHTVAMNAKTKAEMSMVSIVLNLYAEHGNLPTVHQTQNIKSL